MTKSALTEFEQEVITTIAQLKRAIDRLERQVDALTRHDHEEALEIKVYERMQDHE
jgi:hypothetical protein